MAPRWRPYRFCPVRFPTTVAFGVTALALVVSVVACGEVTGTGSQIDGGRADGPTDGGVESTTNVAFVTSTLHTGDLGGVDGADAICNARANAADLPGQYVAWLSSASASASDRLGSASGWVRPDGQPLALDKARLLSGRLLYAPIVDELGNAVSNDETVRTGTTAGGQTGAATCGDWTSTTGSAASGLPVGLGRYWTDERPTECSTPSRIYCFGTGAMEVEAPEVGANRLVFVSVEKLTGIETIGTLDFFCQAEAEDAGHVGTFRGLVALSASSAFSRVLGNTATNLVRADGVPLSERPADLALGNFTASVGFTADLNLVDEPVWLGAPSFHESAITGENCSDWNDVNPPSALVGQASLQTKGTDGGGLLGCETLLRFLCGQE